MSRDMQGVFIYANVTALYVSEQVIVMHCINVQDCLS